MPVRALSDRILDGCFNISLPLCANGLRLNWVLLSQEQFRPFLAEVDAAPVAMASLCLIHEVLDFVVVCKSAIMMILVFSKGNDSILNQFAKVVLSDRLQIWWMNIKGFENIFSLLWLECFQSLVDEEDCPLLISCKPKCGTLLSCDQASSLNLINVWDLTHANRSSPALHVKN